MQCMNKIHHKHHLSDWLVKCFDYTNFLLSKIKFHLMKVNYMHSVGKFHVNVHQKLA